MKIVVIGGTGLIGSKAVAILRQAGHEAVAASPSSGINTITGRGLKEAMVDTQVVIDVANSPSFENDAVLHFFETSARNLVTEEAAAGVRHHIALSIVGVDRSDNGYFRAKVAQENHSRPAPSLTQSSARPNSWNSLAPLLTHARLEMWSGSRLRCSSPSLVTTLLRS